MRQLAIRSDGPQRRAAHGKQPACAASVTRGENAGRTLDEASIVRSIHTLGAWNGAAERLSLDLAEVPDGATDVAALVQTQGPGAILGAVTASLR